MRSLFFLWIKPISKHRWSLQLLDESSMNYVLQRVLSNPPTLGLVTVYLENIYVMDCVCLVIWKVEVSFCLCKFLAGCLWYASHSGLMLIFFNCSILALQCCVNFCCTTIWLSYMYKYIPSLLNLPTTPFNAYLILKVFSFSVAFVRDFVFNCISPTMGNEGEVRCKMFRARSKSRIESVKTSSHHWSHEDASTWLSLMPIQGRNSPLSHVISTVQHILLQKRCRRLS